MIPRQVAATQATFKSFKMERSPKFLTAMFLNDFMTTASAIVGGFRSRKLRSKVTRRVVPFNCKTREHLKIASQDGWSLVTSYFWSALTMTRVGLSLLRLRKDRDSAGCSQDDFELWRRGVGALFWMAGMTSRFR